MNESKNFTVRPDATVVEDPHFINIKEKVENLEYQLNNLSEELGKNVKQFEIITVTKKQTLQTLSRNLDDIQRICSDEFSKFQDTVNRDLEHNAALSQRVQEDINHLADKQSNLRIKLTSVEKRISDLEYQIGNTPYY